MRYDQQPNDARPRLYAHPQALLGGYNPLMHPQHNVVKYEHGAPYYPPPAALHVSSDYQPPASPTPSTNSSAKRSREELNMKEKQRMFKLNERITQLKMLLDEAGVQTKKNKQSVLDNTSHYIEMLRGDLVIAQQKAERAEKQAEIFRTQTYKGQGAVDRAVSGVFEKTTTPRVVVDMDMKTVMFNAAFVTFTGLSELALKKKKTLRPYICADQEKLDAIMTKLRETKQSLSVLVKASATGKDEVVVNVIASVVTDDSGEAVNVEFSLIPMDTQQLPQQRPKRQKMKNDGAATSNKAKDQSAIYVQL
ncbi:Basic helix-loop-helix motif-containing protein [Phytophthora infestans]|uniref:Basic helix-loop-helix motif-containing protein n=1 Tax=Phytophthora infestans TaxID=4787 RepID=A0A833T2X1_PHYIN|nr:Basic helix-loop-helix motif-containing protein [Phytophthora infestans]